MRPDRIQLLPRVADIRGMPKKPALEKQDAKLSIPFFGNRKCEITIAISSETAAAMALHKRPDKCSGVLSTRNPLMITHGREP